MIPPGEGITKKFVQGDYLRKKGEKDKPIHYFDYILPRLKEAENNTTSGGKLPHMIECIQYPGDTVFVPGGWWHAVLNLDNTIAITENVCNWANFDRVWYKMRKVEKRLAYEWLGLIRETNKDLYSRALKINQRDLWIMKTPWDVKVSKDEKVPPLYDENGEEIKEEDRKPLKNISFDSEEESGCDSKDDEMPISKIQKELDDTQNNGIDS